jgi:hypothetical protein
MRQVLAPGGRLALNAWRGLDHNPGWAALAAALDDHAGPEIADLMRAPFSYGDADALRTLAERTGFSGVRSTSTPAPSASHPRPSCCVASSRPFRRPST